MQRQKENSFLNCNRSCDAVVKILTLYTFLRVLDWYPWSWLALQNKHKMVCLLYMPLYRFCVMGNA